jgi:hypothetical protein
MASLQHKSRACSWETTLPIRNLVVHSCKGGIPDYGGGVSLSLSFGMGQPQSLW